MTNIPVPEKNIYVFEIIVYILLMGATSYFGFKIIEEQTDKNFQGLFLLGLMILELKLLEKPIERFKAWKNREYTKEEIEYYQYHKVKAEFENIKLDNEIKKEQLKQLREKTNK
ncbi:hypothetical protein JW930_00300 [Candidatus Woesearchaeota archaeon]|nr:hypothetical protein [Candidatus Woesearchaeota archaeon]